MTTRPSCIVSWNYGFASAEVDSAYISPNDCKIDSLRQFLGLQIYNIYIYTVLTYIHMFIAHVFVLYNQTVCVYVHTTISPVARRPTALQNWTFLGGGDRSYRFSWLPPCRILGLERVPVLSSVWHLWVIQGLEPGSFDPHQKRDVPIRQMIWWYDDMFESSFAHPSSLCYFNPWPNP